LIASLKRQHTNPSVPLCPGHFSSDVSACTFLRVVPLAISLRPPPVQDFPLAMCSRSAFFFYARFARATAFDIGKLIRFFPRAPASVPPFASLASLAYHPKRSEQLGRRLQSVGFFFSTFSIVPLETRLFVFWVFSDFSTPGFSSFAKNGFPTPEGSFPGFCFYSHFLTARVSRSCDFGSARSAFPPPFPFFTPMIQLPLLL